MHDCRSCGEEYGPGYSVPASDRPGICASCAEAMDETHACPGCGQIVGATDDPRPIYCNACRSSLYGGDEAHDRARLFEPAPAQIPGQAAFDV